MNLERFLQRGSEEWSELASLVERARGKPERLAPDDIHRLGSLYRSAAADLALARRRWAGDPATQRLEGLVTRARPLIYDTERGHSTFLTFFSRTYWRYVRERPVLLALAWGLLLVPALLAAWWAVTDPGGAIGLVPQQFRHATEPRGGDLGVSVPEQAAFASAIFTNNIRVTFLAFAGGIAAGLATAGVLIFNGTFLGAVAGLAFESGNGRAFVELVTAHGVLELSCIAVSAAAGLRIGAAIVAPGRLRRGEVVRSEARVAVAIVLGTAPWLVVAGLVEGFVTPAGLGLGPVVTIGASLGIVFWTLVFVRGRARSDPET
ncbi:MAG TPA: stage II sporulation protein M [Actinomycetota bacterium]|nr:stage II sporulation protein M [Actinomycetota bacterium]